MKILLALLLFSSFAMASSTRSLQADNIASPATLTKVLGLSFTGQTASTTLTLAPLSTTSQTLQIPNITATDTIATLGLAQTFSGAKTFSAAPTFSTLTTAGVLLNSAAGLVSSSAGPLAVANGGTGSSTALTQWGIKYASTTTAEATTAAGTAGQYLMSNGTSAPTWQSLRIAQEVPSGTVNGSTTAFTLAHTPLTQASLTVYVDGQAQLYTTDYSLATATITFVTAPATGQKIFATYNY